MPAQSYRILRDRDNDVLANFDGVLEDIHRAMTTTPHP
jgi:very-short-patch-repair endonuclease